MPALPDKHHTQFNLVPLQSDRHSLPSHDDRASEPDHQRGRAPNQGLNKQNGSSLPEPSRKLLRGQLKELCLPDIVNSGDRADEALVVRSESPWDTFSKVYECELAGSVAVVERRVRPSTV